MKWARNRTGFTIVELLIVVVVIAILAAITVVSYNGITARANETAVKTDLHSIGQQIELFHAEKARYPSLYEFTSNDPDVMKIRVAKGSYATGDAAVYCVAPSMYALIAKASSGKVYYVSSSSGGVMEASFSNAGSENCADVDASLGTSGVLLRSSRSGWPSWVNG